MHLIDSQLDAADVALESIANDLNAVVRDGGGQNPMEAAIAVRRWNTLAGRFGFESESSAVGTVWAVMKKITSASAERFGKVVESIQIYFDKSGGKEIDRLRRLLEENRGDGEGVMTDQSLATSLNVNGRVPSDFGEATHKLVGLVHLLEKIVPSMAAVSKQAYAVCEQAQTPANREELSKHLKALVDIVIAAPSPVAQLPSALFHEQFVGGRRFAEEHQIKPLKNASVPERNASKLLELVSSLKFALSGPKPVQPAVNPRLPVLNREQIKDLLGHCEQLTDALHHLLVLAKNHSKDATGSAIAQHLDAVFANIAREHPFKIPAEDKARADWLKLYFQSNLTNPKRLIESGLRILADAHKAYASYIHASIQQFK
jgi:hypothetical protein